MLCGGLDGSGVWGRMDTCICMAESLCCSPETMITLLMGYQFSSVQSLTSPWTVAHQASLSFTNSRSLLKLMFIESVMPSNISSSVIPFSSCLQSFPASGSFPRSQFFASGGQSFGVSASELVLSMNIQA